MKTRQRTLDGQQAERDEPQTALSKRERDQTPDAQDSWSDAVAAKRLASEAETQPTQPPDEARAPASPPEAKTARNRNRPQARDLVHSVKVDLHLCLMQAATEGDDERVSWALARGGDPRNPESDGDVVLEDMRQQGAQTLSPVARAALSPNVAGGTLCVRRLLDDGRCNAYAPEYCLTRFRPEVDALMETQLDSGSVTSSAQIMACTPSTRRLLDGVAM